MTPSVQRGFTLLELMVCMTILAVAAALIIPALTGGREGSRKQACADNMRQIGLAELEYEQSYKRLSCFNITWGCGDVGVDFWNQPPAYGGAGRWGGFIALLPYLGQVPLHDAFHKGTSGQWNNQTMCWGPYGSIASNWQAISTSTHPDVLRYPWSAQYRPNRTHVSIFRCPADPTSARSNSMWRLARTNYAHCLGDGQIGTHGGDTIVDTVKGAFQRNTHHSLAAITDGAANTIAFGEIATPNTALYAMQKQGVTELDAKTQGRAIYELPLQPDFKGIDVMACRAFVKQGRYAGTKRNWNNLGTHAYDALAPYTGFNTINPPNGGSCTPTDDPWGQGEGIYTASSYHLGGAHVVTFDGSVKYVSNNIATNDTRIGMNLTDYYPPGRQYSNNKWQQTPNWTAESPFGVWGAMGTRSGNEYAGYERPIP